MMYGDGREERQAAALLAMRLGADPKVRARKAEYERQVAAARAEAQSMTDAQVIDRLIEHNPAYIRSLLETEDERFGTGALRERYARTFYRSPAAAFDRGETE